LRTRIILTALISCAASLALTRGAEPPAANAVPTPAASPTETEISDTTTRLELARLLSYDKRYAEAIAVYHQVLAVEPQNLDAMIGLGEVLFWTGNIEAAASMLKGIPEDKLDDKGKLMLADLMVAKKDYGSAIRILSASLERNPDDLAIRLKLADAQTWTKRYPEAIANYEQILKARPNDRQIRRKYGLVLSWAGQNEKAAEQLRQSLNE
jgi:thioredoxin-like negative regulator of GroEL